MPTSSIKEVFCIRPELAPDAFEPCEIDRIEELAAIGEFRQHILPERLDLDLDIDPRHIAEENEGDDAVRGATNCIRAFSVGESARSGFEQFPFEIMIISRNGNPSIEDC